ncbi:MAG: glycosyltransferase family 92 protein [Bacteroidaceae bacterium]
MNKVLAEIIAGVIPHKMTRNRWRGILRYGIINAYRLKHTIKNNHSTPEYYLAVCAIAKNEGPYFKEWIEWHHTHGVDKFYIYDNESTDNTRTVLKPYINSGLVDYIYWPGHRQQLAVYDNCIENNRFSTRWMAFIDLDEFIVPLKDASIPAFLKRFESFSAVEINWLIYGSSGERTKSEKPVMDRFQKHSVPNHYLNRHVKSIVNPRRVFNMIGCHEAAKISGFAADSHLHPIVQHFRSREPQQDVIRINHYAVRSYEEFTEKQARGRASGRQKKLTLEYFKQYDLNDIDEKNNQGKKP